MDTTPEGMEDTAGVEDTTEILLLRTKVNGTDSHQSGEKHDLEEDLVKHIHNEVRIEHNGATEEAMRERTESTQPPLMVMTKLRTWLNLVILSLSMTLLFSAYTSFENLQSSLNHADGLGTSGLAVLYAVFILTSVFVSAVVLAKFSAKWIIALSMVGYSTFLATGFHATWATVIPATVVVGVAASHLWVSQQDYVHILAQNYATVTQTNVDHALNLFFGVFYGIYSTSRIVGNLLASVILRRDSPMMMNITDNITDTNLFSDESQTSSCGANFCSQALTNSTAQLLRPPDRQVDIYTAVCLGLAGVAVISSVALLTRTPVKDSGKKSAQLARSVIKHMIKSREQHLLVIPSLFKGLMQAFMQGDLTIAFVSCPYGVENVGFVMILHGVMASLSSLLLGKLSKYTGWLPLFVLAFLTQLSVGVVFLLWKPVRAEMYVIYIVVAITGLGDVIYMLGLASIYSVHFKQSPAAVPCFRVLMSLGTLVSFAYSSHLCMRDKTYVMMAVAFLSILCMIIFFRRNSCSACRAEQKE